MNILYGSCQAISFLDEGGGIRREILDKKKAIEMRGHEVKLFNQWEKYDFENYDIFHLFSSDLRTYILAKEISLKNIKLIVSPIIDFTHSNKLIKIYNSLIKRIPKAISNTLSQEIVCNLADHVIVRSEEERLRVENFNISNNNISKVYNYVDKDFSNVSKEKFVNKFDLDNFLLTVGLVGNPRKNFLKLIKIAGELDIKLVIIGKILDNKYSRDCLEEAKKFENINILGYVNYDILKSAYAAADTFILPSLMEGTGLAALEAGLSGAKIIITENGGTKDYFGNYANYIDPYSKKSIRKEIKNIYGSDSNNNLKKHIFNNFTIEKIGESLESVYIKTLNN